MNFLMWIFLITFIALHLVDDPAPLVTIDQGVLSGKISRDGTFYEYLGIPYATTNKETRFQAPLPPPTWKGIFKAVHEGPSCPQKSFIGIMGEEDCLKINIYVPPKAEKPIPVLVFIHGGAFLLGSGGQLVYAPGFLIKNDVIIVTFNYRLGVLGFLCLGIKEAPGNAGLKDQVAALRWIKKNIAAFGGDPDNITIFGESAGGTSTSIMIATEATNGLFKRAIVQSGSSVSNWAINRSPVWTAGLLMKVMGYNTEDPHEIYDILSKASFEDFVDTKTKKPWDKFFDTELIHLPCVEKPFPGEEPILPDLPYNLLTSAKRKNISVIYGTNDKEGLFLISEENEITLGSRNKGYIFASDLEFKSEEEAEALSKITKQFYFGDGQISMDKIANVSDLYTQLYFEMPAMFEADLFLEDSNTIVYNYLFKYAGSRNIVKVMSGNRHVAGACHGDELLYLFDGKVWPLWINKKDQKMIEWMSKMWTNFAKFGNPTPESDNDLPIRWSPSKKDDLKFLYIDEELTMGPIPNREAYLLWKDVYTKYRKRSWGY